MSLREIIEELPRLSADELAAVEARLRELKTPQAESPVTWGSALLEIAGSAEGLPADFAENHDRYLHGADRVIG